MRATGPDIIELFGYAPDDSSAAALAAWKKKFCPFTLSECGKMNHDQTVTYGTCSVSHGVQKRVGTEVIVCPRRLYGQKCSILSQISKYVWPSAGDVVVGGELSDLKSAAKKTVNPVVAFGQQSGREIHINSNGGLSFDWILQRYIGDGRGQIEPRDFIGLEIQTLDTTGNYRDNCAAYAAIKKGKILDTIPNSGHGLNWANVHKRLIPQLIRKGNVLKNSVGCVGFFFVVPQVVYSRFQEVIGQVPELATHGKDRLSVVRCSLGPEVPHGQIRPLIWEEPIHFDLQAIAESFIRNTSNDACTSLDEKLQSMFN